MITETRRSVCPYDCPDTCGLLVEVQNGRAVRVSGDPEHPYTRGTLCPKMLHYERIVHSPRRLTTPLVRTGRKGDGSFRPASMEEAVSLIATKWREIIATHGAEAILPYSYAGTMGLVQRNAGHAFFHRMGASRLARTICSPAKDAGWKAVMGETVVPHPDSVRNSDLVILWGINAAATSIHFLRGVKEARARGARVWLVDTYETPTAASADRTFLVRPGSDGALALGIMHLLDREGLADEPFIAAHVRGYEELRREILPDYPPERVAALTGLPVPVVREMAREYGTARAPFIRLGSGLSRYGNGAMTIRTIACLPAVAGAYGKEGGGCFPGTSTGGAFAMEEILREDFMTASTRIINMNRLGHALNELSDPPVMGLYVYHSNPAAITPDQNAVLRGLEREDLFTVVHERFLTDTARYADVVLPATSSLEHPDIYRAYGTYCIQRAAAVIPPVGESLSNREMFSLLADKMGYREEFFHLETERLIDHLLAVSSSRGKLPVLPAAGETALELPLQRFSSFGTPSGKIEILNRGEPEPLPRWIPPHSEGDPYPLRLMTAPNIFSLNASFYELDELREKQRGMLLLLNPEDAAARSIAGGERVAAWNGLGEAEFIAEVTGRTPPGVAVAEGVWWLEFVPGNRSVNALVSQRLTDRGEGSTFYDNRIEVRKAAPAPVTERASS
jgi:anaerobic selenocysteine-containing dehydrogenase